MNSTKGRNIDYRLVWKMVKSEMSFESLMFYLPTVTCNRINDYRKKLEKEYKSLEVSCVSIVYSLDDAPKISQEEIILGEYKNVSSILFSMLKHKDYSKHIWKVLMPDDSKFFYKEGKDCGRQ